MKKQYEVYGSKPVIILIHLALIGMGILSIVFLLEETRLDAYLLIVAPVLFILIVFNYLIGDLRRAKKVIIADKGISCSGLLNQSWQLEFEQLREVRAENNFGSWQIRLIPFGNNSRVIIIPASMGEFGELVENVLTKAAQVEYIEEETLLKFSRIGDVWKKVPDHEIIVQAINRAKENASRSMNSQNI